MVETYVRCLNLSVSVGIALYEAARQLNYEQLQYQPELPEEAQGLFPAEDIYAWELQSKENLIEHVVERLLSFLPFSLDKWAYDWAGGPHGILLQINSKPILCRGALHMLIQNVY